MRSQLTRRLWKIDSPEVNAFLLDEVVHGPTVGNRVAAAYPLRKRERLEALATVLAEWRAVVDPQTPAPRPGLFSMIESSDDPESPGHLLAFLLSSDDPEAICAVQDVWQRFDAQRRSDIIDRCGRRLRAEADDETAPLSVATRDAIEALLVAAVADDTVLTGWNMGGAKAPRIAELSAAQLAQGWPSKFRFDLSGCAKRRAAQLAMIRRRVKK